MKEIENEDIRHLCSTDYGSSGSPILCICNQRVIGVHKRRTKEEYNEGTFIKYAIEEFNKVYHSSNSDFKYNINIKNSQQKVLIINNRIIEFNNFKIIKKPDYNKTIKDKNLSINNNNIIKEDKLLNKSFEHIISSHFKINAIKKIQSKWRNYYLNKKKIIDNQNNIIYNEEELINLIKVINFFDNTHENLKKQNEENVLIKTKKKYLSKPKGRIINKSLNNMEFVKYLKKEKINNEYSAKRNNNRRSININNIYYSFKNNDTVLKNEKSKSIKKSSPKIKIEKIGETIDDNRFVKRLFYRPKINDVFNLVTKINKEKYEKKKSKSIPKKKKRFEELYEMGKKIIQFKRNKPGVDIELENQEKDCTFHPNLNKYYKLPNTNFKADIYNDQHYKNFYKRLECARLKKRRKDRNDEMYKLNDIFKKRKKYFNIHLDRYIDSEESRHIIYKRQETFEKEFNTEEEYDLEKKRKKPFLFIYPDISKGIKEKKTIYIHEGDCYE